MRCRLFKWEDVFGGWGKGEQVNKSATPSGTSAALPPEELPFPPELLDSTFLRGRQLALAFRASRDGWSAAVFHQACDFKGCVARGGLWGEAYSSFQSVFISARAQCSLIAIGACGKREAEVYTSSPPSLGACMRAQAVPGAVQVHSRRGVRRLQPRRLAQHQRLQRQPQGVPVLLAEGTGAPRRHAVCPA